MEMIKTKLKITLKSDLCVSSGFSYAGVVDNDITYNKNGIPYISGRRIKGCLREAAEQILLQEETILSVFGSGGNDRVEGVMVGNAFPKGWEEIDGQLSVLKGKEDQLAACLNTQNILNLFADVKAQTKLTEEGCADENTLRFTRTISRYDCISGEELTFLAPFSYAKKDEQIVQKILKATRHIGTNRNRGLGNVVLELESEEKKTEVTVRDESKKNSGSKKKITYVIKNVDPLMLSATDEICSIHYIPGSNVLGTLAGEYLKNGTPEDEMFIKFFLSGETIFSDLTITKKIAGEWRDYAPAPLYLNRLKKTKRLVNLLGENINSENKESDYYMKDGNQPKKLKNHFVTMLNQAYDVLEVDTEIVYHHTQKGIRRSEEKDILYFLETVGEKQYFRGSILVDEKDCDQMLTLLKKTSLRFGKSKSAQYGTCRLEEICVEDYKPMEIDTGRAGEHIVLTFLSDAVFMDKDGNFTVNKETVADILAKEFHLLLPGDEKATFIETKEITGYNTKWNLKKQAIPAIKAGSSFEFVIAPNSKEKINFVGEKNLEGFGKIRVDYIRDVKFEAAVVTDEKDQQKIKKEVIKDVTKLVMKERIYEEISGKVFRKDTSSNISPSGLGRITLMLTECENETRGMKNSAFEMLKKYIRRINSIKIENKQDEVKRFIKASLGEMALKILNCEAKEKPVSEAKVKQDVVRKLIEDDKEKAISITDTYTILKDVVGSDEAEELVFNLWPGYFKNILTYAKYNKKN